MSLVSSELAEDIEDVTCQVWESVLSLEALNGAPAGNTTTTVSSSVHIIGEWTGAVSLSMTDDLATTIATTMFELDTDDLSPADIDDAVGEMANMIGGNIKSLLPGPAQLSMPAVSRGDQPPHFPGTEVVEHLDFAVEGQRFSVTLLHERNSHTTVVPGSTAPTAP